MFLGGQLADLQNGDTRGGEILIHTVDLNTSGITTSCAKRLFCRTQLRILTGPKWRAGRAGLSRNLSGSVPGTARSENRPGTDGPMRLSYSYPFHPSYKDILSHLSRKREVQGKPAALSSFTANLMRGRSGAGRFMTRCS